MKFKIGLTLLCLLLTSCMLFKDRSLIAYPDRNTRADWICYDTRGYFVRKDGEIRTTTANWFTIKRRWEKYIKVTGGIVNNIQMVLKGKCVYFSDISHI